MPKQEPEVLIFMNFRIPVLILLLGSSACTSSRMVKKLKVVTETWSVVQIADSNEFVIVAKGGHDLKLALESMGCDTKPCTVGRLGQVYSVTTVTVNSPTQKAQPSSAVQGLLQD